MADYLSDLAAFTPEQINQACAEYRRNGENRFFPTSGQIRELIQGQPSEPRRHLTTFRGYPALEAPRATKSVAEVLRAHGMDRAAESWDRK